MANFITAILALLVHMDLLSKADAEKLNVELQSATLPSEFESAYNMVKDVLDKLDLSLAAGKTQPSVPATSQKPAKK